MRRHIHRLLGHLPAAAELLRVSLRGNLAVIAVFVLVPVSGLGAFAMPSWAVHRISAPLLSRVSSPLALDRLPSRVLDAGAALGGSLPSSATSRAVEPLRAGTLRRSSRATASWLAGERRPPSMAPRGPVVPQPDPEPAPPATVPVGDGTPEPEPHPPSIPPGTAQTPSAGSPVDAPPTAPGSPHDPTASDPSWPPAAPPVPGDHDSPEGDEGSASGGEDDDGAGADPSDPADSGEPEAPGKPGKPDKPDKPDKSEKPGEPDDPAEDKPGNGPPDDKPGSGPPEDKPGKDRDADEPDPGRSSDRGKGKNGGRRRRGGFAL